VIILSALLDKLVSAGVLTPEERREISDLHGISSVIAGKQKQFFSPAERIYLEKIDGLLKEKKFNHITRLTPPENLSRFHAKLTKALAFLSDTGGIVSSLENEK